MYRSRDPPSMLEGPNGMFLCSSKSISVHECGCKSAADLSLRQHMDEHPHLHLSLATDVLAAFDCLWTGAGIVFDIQMYLKFFPKIFKITVPHVCSLAVISNALNALEIDTSK